MDYQTTNPATEELIKTFPEHTDRQLEQFIATAQEVYESDWRRRSIAERKAVVKKAALLLRERLDDFAKLVTLEMGKLCTEAQAEVTLSADILDYYADEAERFLMPRKLHVAGGEAVIESEPLGVLFCVEPWNFPYYQLARVAGPDLMAGNVLIVKHAPNVPQCALAFERLFEDAGAPKGVYTNVFLSNQQAAKAIADPRIKGVALTGSERAGSAVASEAGHALKKTTNGTWRQRCVYRSGRRRFGYRRDVGCLGKNDTGECCVAAKRFILHETIADTFLERIFRLAVSRTPATAASSPNLASVSL